jgi:hypothetical protein
MHQMQVKKITTYQSAELNSAFNTEHGHIGIILTENRETLLKKRRIETPTDTYAKKATHLEVIKIKSGIKEEGHQSSYWTEVTHADSNRVHTLKGGGKRFPTDLWSMWCLEFIEAEPDERIRQVMMYGDCTVCLIRDHNTDSHMARAAGKPENYSHADCMMKSARPTAPASSIQHPIEVFLFSSESSFIFRHIDLLWH